MADYASKFIEEQITDFTMVDNALLLTNYLTDAELRVYLVIRKFAYGKKDYCWPSQETIAKAVGKTRETVNRIIQCLKTKEMLTVLQRGLRQSCVYTLCKLPAKLMEAYQALFKQTEVSETVESPSLLELTETSQEENKENNTNVVVVENEFQAKNYIQEADKLRPSITKNIPVEPSQPQTETTPAPIVEVYQIINAVKAATGCAIDKPDAQHILSRWSIDYVLGKVNDVVCGSNIKKNVTGWIIRCCEGDWKKIKPDKFTKSKAKARPPKEVGNSYYVPADAKKKAMLEALYRN